MSGERAPDVFAGEGVASGARARSGYLGPGSSSGGLRLEFPPEYYSPRGATDFFLAGTAVAPAPAAGWVELARAQIPATSRGIIRGVTFQVAGTVTLATDLQWRIRVDNAAVPGWTVPLFGRSAAFVSLSFEAESTFIRLPVGASVSLDFNLAAGAGVNIGASVRGWSWGQSYGD